MKIKVAMLSMFWLLVVALFTVLMLGMIIITDKHECPACCVVEPTPVQGCVAFTATPTATPEATGTPAPTERAPTATPTPVIQPTPTRIVPTLTPVSPTATPRPTEQPTPRPTPVPTVEVEKCNRGLGNGSEECDPGNSGGQPGKAGEGDG